MNGDEGMMGEKYLIPNTTLKTHSDGHYIFSICWLLFLQGWETFKMESSCEFCPKMGSKTLVNRVTTDSSKHLTKQNIWMSISSLILVNNPTSVLNATNHVLTHSQGKPHSCVQCNYSWVLVWVWIQSCWKFEEPHVNSFWGEAAQVFPMQLLLHW